MRFWKSLWRLKNHGVLVRKKGKREREGMREIEKEREETQMIGDNWGVGSIVHMVTKGMVGVIEFSHFYYG